MSRQNDYVRKCPDSVLKRIEKAKSARLYVLQEMGPLGFIVSDDGNGTRKFRIHLGSTHSCSCNKHAGLCVHVLWVMLKVFHTSLSSETLYQTSLVDREIEEMINNRNKKRKVKKEPIIAADPKEKKEEDLVAPRQIEDGDICPICQDEISIHSSTIHCYTSCGNHMHIKCLKILIKHQESLGKEIVRCPVKSNNDSYVEMKLVTFNL
jgi:E3 ubiquitin-protein ligase ZSWIM2